MYANKDFTIFANYQDETFCNFVTEEEMKNILNQKIKENKIVNKYLRNEITTEQFLLHIQDIILDCFKRLFAKTDEYIAMRNKRMILDIWTEEDEQEFQAKMQEYKNLVLEYRQRKQDCLNLAGNKQELINYYNTILLPRLEELNNGL